MRRESLLRTSKPLTFGLLVVAFAMPFCATAHGEGLEPYTPSTDQLRSTIVEVVERQVVHPPLAIEQRVHDALQSINEIEGRIDPQLARHLSAHLKSTWRELERSRVVGELGYTEFDNATFRTSEARFQEIVARYSGARGPYSKARNRATLKALTDIQALSRLVRHQVPGVSSDDVVLIREKRQKLMMKEPRTQEGTGTPSEGLAMPSR